LLTTSEGAPECPDLIEDIGMGSFRFSSDGQTATGKYYLGLDNAIQHEYINMCSLTCKRGVAFSYDREGNIRFDI
jgi:hypothetical protein